MGKNGSVRCSLYSRDGAQHKALCYYGAICSSCSNIPSFYFIYFLLPLGELLLATLSQSFYFFSFVSSSGRIRIYQEAIDDET